MSDLEWPREIWMAERDEHDQGVVSAVLSVHATIVRWEGDKQRDREFHRYVDADIHESAERYYSEMTAQNRARIEALQAENARLREALGACARGDITIIEAGRISRAALGYDADDLSVCKDRELEDEISWEELWGDDNG